MHDRRTSGLKMPLSEALKPALDARDGGRAREERLWAQIRSRRGMGGHSEPPKAGQYLPIPVSRVLKLDDSMSDRSRLWRGIRARQSSRPAASENARGSWRLPALGLGFATAVFAIGFVIGVRPPSGEQVALVEPLTLSNGQAVRAVDAHEAAQVIRLADASTIRLEKGAKLEPLLSSGSRFELLLREGSAVFSVTPHGPRRWVIEAGLATVEVVGTEFRVERKPSGVQVFVSHGTVLVRGDNVPDRVQRLTAGHSISVRPRSVAASESTVNPASPDAANAAITARIEGVAPTPTDADGAEMVVTEHEVAVAEEAAARRATPAKRRAKTDWRQHVARGEFNTAYTALGPQGLLQAVQLTEQPQRLLELADVARLSGHPVESVKPLDRLLSLHPESPHAGIAAFTLGRVYLDQLEQPTEAAKAFERAIALHPPRALLADCHVRLIEAYSRAGDRASAQRAAARYRRLFPTGRELTDTLAPSQR